MGAISGGGYRPLMLGKLRQWLPIWLALAFVALQFLGANQEPAFNDTYRYAYRAELMLGVAPTEAHLRAVTVMCERSAIAKDQERSLNPWVHFHSSPRIQQDLATCVARNSPAVYPSDPRYVRIFDSRPGYPMLVAPFIALLGVKWGLFTGSFLLGAVGGLLIYLLIRLAGAGRLPAMAGQVLFYVLPIGYWSSRTLAEGAMMDATLLVVIGAWLLLQRRIRGGLAAVIGGYAALLVIKYSQGSLLAAALVCAVGLIWLADRSRRHLGTVLLLGASAVAFAVEVLVPNALGWPGLDVSLQEAFTYHFTHPDVPDPLVRLIKMDRAVGSGWLTDQAAQPLLAVALAVGLWALWRWHRSLALLIAATAATGFVSVAVHPVWLDVDRISLEIWVIAVCGLPLLLPIFTRNRTTPTDTPIPGPQSPQEDGLISIH